MYIYYIYAFEFAEQCLITSQDPLLRIEHLHSSRITCFLLILRVCCLSLCSYSFLFTPSSLRCKEHT